MDPIIAVILILVAVVAGTVVGWLLGARSAAPVRSELVYLLVGLDREFTSNAPAVAWEPYYAQRLVEHFA